MSHYGSRIIKYDFFYELCVIWRKHYAQEDPVDITKSLDNGIYTITLSGKFTFFDHAAFREILEEMSQEKIRGVVLDMAALTFIDSAGLGQLLLAQDEATKYHKSLVIKGATGQVRKMFGVAHFDTIFTLQE